MDFDADSALKMNVVSLRDLISWGRSLVMDRSRIAGFQCWFQRHCQYDVNLPIIHSSSTFLLYIV